MRVLLDEQLPRHLARDLTAHQVRTVQQEGWTGLKNGELLQRAANSGFDVFVTADQNLEFQQNLTRPPLGRCPRCGEYGTRGPSSFGAGDPGSYRKGSSGSGHPGCGLTPSLKVARSQR